MLFEYNKLLIVIVIGFIISLIIVSVSYLLISRSKDIEKLSAYECGFHPFSDARIKFEIKFYLVSILFIIFDIEISMLFPFGLTISLNNYFGFWSMFIFLLILLVGFVYEWLKGALDW